MILGLGAVLVVVGALMVLSGRLGMPSLPGDISWRRGNVRVLIPLGTSLVISLVLTLILNLLLRR
ncbi:MAG: DUF2905 family protein [Actinomycetota bacterium]